MPVFTPNQPIITEDGLIKVEDLPPGKYRFQLVVEDNDGLLSAPVQATVAVSSGGDPSDPRNRDVEAVSGIGTVYGRRLKENGITTVGGLLKLRPMGLAEILGISKDQAEGLLKEAYGMVE